MNSALSIDGIGAGLVVYRASRLDSLLSPLTNLLAADHPATVLAPQTVLVGHPGMRPWLQTAIARRRGIAANLQMLLPGVWLEGLALDVLGTGEAAVAAWRRESLRWHVHEQLPALDDAGLRASLQGVDAPRRRFQLADRLARMFVQYIVYRPDWLRAWERGRDPTGEAGFLVPLWQRLRAQIRQPHRGERLEVLAKALADAPRLPDDSPLHVFGLGHLAPAELAVLQAVGRHRLVVLYVPDPCRVFWAGLPHDAGKRIQLLHGDPDAGETESAFQRQVRHPLLGALGRIGQHLLLLLEDAQATIDVRDYRDEPERDAVPTTRLLWLQEGIRRGEPALALPAHARERTDASLRVHACHTRLRELEVLRDALLRQLRDDPGLRPGGILVMAPDIRAYAPMLPAVFGAPGVWDGPLPWQLADVSIASSDPVYTAFRRLLDLPYSRFTAPEAIDLLSLPPLARRWELDPADLDTIEGWLRQARVAWGLDGSFRERCGAPAIAEQTLAWGMERLLAGYALGQEAGDPQALALPDGEAVLPLPGVGGAQAALAGTLDAALAELARWQALGTRSMAASAWAEELEERIGASLRALAGDDTSGEALDDLRAIVRQVSAQPRACGLDPQLPFAVVREFLVQALDAVPGNQRFLRGGITFCGMVPQRAIPFDVIAVLGLDEGALPRSDDGAGIDPIIRHRRLGDRDTRNDDRWLFLQTLMSARKALHLSYQGASVRDGQPLNPAAPLAELMHFLDDASAGDTARDDGQPEAAAGEESAVPSPAGVAADARPLHPMPRPWWVQHPLQSFDPRYRDGSDAALFAFATQGAASHGERPAGLAMTSDAAAGTASPGTPASATAGDAAAATTSERIVALRELLAFYKDPAKEYLAGRLRLRLDACADDGLRESESLEANFDAVERVGRRVFLDAIGSPNLAVPGPVPDWLRLSGLLPPGRPGTQAWEREAEQVRTLLGDMDHDAMRELGRAPARPLRVDVAIGAWRVRGEAARVREVAAGYRVFDAYPGKTEADLGFKERIGLFLEWALLRLDPAHASRSVCLLLACEGGSGPWQRAIARRDEAILQADGTCQAGLLDDLRGRVRVLLDLRDELLERPPGYFPRTSWVAATVANAGRTDHVAKAWDDSGRRGERNYAPGYARLLGGKESFAIGTPGRKHLDAVARVLHGAIALDADPGAPA